jgi:hypothetical protein
VETMTNYGPGYGIIWEPNVHYHTDFVPVPEFRKAGAIAHCSCDKYLVALCAEWGLSWYEINDNWYNRHLSREMKKALTKLDELGIKL